jgi:prephenate dehydrogenase
MDISPATDDSTGEAPRSVLIIGTGLLGTSVALAVRPKGTLVHLVDRDPAVAERASELGAGVAGWPMLDPEIIVIGAPPPVVGEIVADAQRRYPTSVVTDLASAKLVPERDVRAAGGDLARFVGGHPLAGRERSGPQAARGDLFEGRPWVLTPSAETASDAYELVRLLVLACDAVPVEMSATEHDVAVALVSHAPHVVAASVAGRLLDASPAAVALAGQGVRDVTRIAASDPELWIDILVANAGPVGQVVAGVRHDLDGVLAALEVLQDVDRSDQERTEAAEDLRAFLGRGVGGRAAIPGKHGGASVRYVGVPVVVPDAPGELARLFAAAGEAGVNIEDLTIEHSPGQPVGLIELAVRPGAVAELVAALRAGGWTVQD